MWGVARGSRGRVVSQVGWLTGLQVLNFGYMNLQGSFPSQLGRLTLLRELNVRLNEFTGTLPTQLTQLTKLAHLDCSFNQFTGPFPPVPSSVTYLDVRANRFVGSLVGQLNTTANNCKAMQIAADETSCFSAVPNGCGQNCVGGLTGVCTSSLPLISLANGSSSPATFRGCPNDTDRSVFSLPKSYLFSPVPPPGLFALDVAPATNVTLLLNETVLSIGAATAFFIATTPVAIGVRQTNATVKPVVTVRACSCDGDSAVFSAALVNGSDSLVALTVNASLALQASLQQGRRVRGVFCAPAKHHYAVGVRAGTVVLKFDRLSIFGSAVAKPVVPQTALSLYLVPASGGTAISRVVELFTNASTRPGDVLLSPTVAPVEEAVLVLAASVPLMYSVSFTLADCLQGDESWRALRAGVRTVSNLCPAGDRDTFAASVQAGNFTLTVDVGRQELSAPLVLKATLTVFESTQQRNVTAQPACVLEPFVAHNASSCSWEFGDSDGFLVVVLAADNSNLTLTGYGVTLAFVPRDTQRQRPCQHRSQQRHRSPLPPAAPRRRPRRADATG